MCRLTRKLRSKSVKKHREYVVEHIPLDTTDMIAALIEIETDEATVRALRAALQERESVLLVLSHEPIWFGTTPTEDAGPMTSPLV